MSNSLKAPTAIRVRKRRTVAKMSGLTHQHHIAATVSKKTQSTPISQHNGQILNRTTSMASNGSLKFDVQEEILESSKSKSSFERFCNATSLHGWKYLSSNVNLALRIGWVAVVLGSMGVAGFFLGYSCNNFLSSTVQTTQDTSR